jgi:hypothetical protein
MKPASNARYGETEGMKHLAFPVNLAVFIRFPHMANCR